MFCSSCGYHLADDAAYCSHCGAPQRFAAPAPRAALHPAIIASMLVFFFPLGLILMWTSSDWDPDLKWAITGFIFPPLWLRFLWKAPWLGYAFIAGLALLLGHAVTQDGFSLAAAIAIWLTVTVFLLALKPGRTRKPRLSGAQLAALRRAIDAKLDSCHDLIAEIESTLALDLLPADSLLRREYARALELRDDGLQLLRRAKSRAELVEVEARISGALSDLHSVKDGIGQIGP